MTFADLKILMARRYYRRRTVVVRPKKKWASNMQISGLDSTTPYAVLAQNSAQSSSPTPIIVKVGNIKLQGDATVTVTPASASATASLVIVVYYLPEGITLTATTPANIISQHPEWIMAWKQLDLPNTINASSAAVTLSGNSFTVSSRLKRNLNSGDKICIGYVSDNASAVPVIKYTAQYWTCAN